MQYGKSEVQIRQYITKAYGMHIADHMRSFVTLSGCSIDGSDCMSAVVVVVVVVVVVKIMCK